MKAVNLNRYFWQVLNKGSCHIVDDSVFWCWSKPCLDIVYKTYQTDRLYYRAVIKVLSSRNKWRFTRYFSRKYYTWFVTFSFPIWSSLTSSLLSHNRCYGQLNDSSNSVPLHPFMTYWDSDLSKEWEINNKKLRQ